LDEPTPIKFPDKQQIAPEVNEGAETSRVEENPLKKKRTKRVVEEDPEDMTPKPSFLDKFSHLKCSREKFVDKEFRICVGLLLLGFLLWIFGFIMCGQSSNYLQKSPAMIPTLSVLTGFNTLIQGYAYLLDFNRKTMYFLCTFGWQLFHFISLIIVSFVSVIYYGPQFSIVGAYLLLGVSLGALITQAIKQYKRRSFFGNYLVLNIWLAFHSFVVVILANLSPVKAGGPAVLVFLHLFLLWPIMYWTQRFLLSKVAPSDVGAYGSASGQRYMLS
jgi:hypothetical protein